MRQLIGCRRLGPIPVTPKCWKEGAGVAQCKVHPETPLSGHPATDTSDLVRLGVSLSPDLLSPSVAESLRPGARQTLGLSPWTGTAPPTPPSRHFLPAPLPGGCSEAKTATPQPDRLSGCSPGWGREAPRRIRNTVPGPAWGVSSMEKLVNVEEAERREGSCN